MIKNNKSKIKKNNISTPKKKNISTPKKNNISTPKKNTIIPFNEGKSNISKDQLYLLGSEARVRPGMPHTDISIVKSEAVDNDYENRNNISQLNKKRRYLLRELNSSISDTESIGNLFLFLFFLKFYYR